MPYLRLPDDPASNPDDIFDDVVETCPHCDAENYYDNVDLKRCGFCLPCQGCGREIMICSMCQNENNRDCDWRPEDDDRGWCQRMYPRFESKAKALIDDFCRREYGNEADFKNVKDVPLAHTETAYEGRYGLQVNVNIPACSFEYYLNDRHVASDKIMSHEGFLQSLEYMDFAELISVFDFKDKVLDEVLDTIPDKMEFMLLNDKPLFLEAYLNLDGLVLTLSCIDDEYTFDEYADMTVNVSGFKSEPGCALVNVNQYFMEDLINKYNLGVPTGRYATSGFVTYPEYKFDFDTIKKYALGDNSEAE